MLLHYSSSKTAVTVYPSASSQLLSLNAHSSADQATDITDLQRNKSHSPDLAVNKNNLKA